MLGKILRHKTDQARGKFRILHNQEFHNLHELLSTVKAVNFRILQWARHISWLGEEKCMQSLISWKMAVLNVKKERKNKIKVYLAEIGSEEERWIELPQDCNQWQHFIINRQLPDRTQ